MLDATAARQLDAITLDTGDTRLDYSSCWWAPLLLAAAALAGLTATAAKWPLVGRFTAGERPLWSSFVWRNELYERVRGIARRTVDGRSVHRHTGAELVAAQSGARIGRRVWCDSYRLPETDLVTLGDGVSVNRGSVLQTHLFHDRIMRLDAVHLAAGASLGPLGIILPGTPIGARTSVGPSSLVMRGENVPAGTRWAGNPVAGCGRRAVERRTRLMRRSSRPLVRRASGR